MGLSKKSLAAEVKINANQPKIQGAEGVQEHLDSTYWSRIQRGHKRRMEEQKGQKHGRHCRLSNKYRLSFCGKHQVVSDRENRDSLSLDRLNSDIISTHVLLAHVTHPQIQASCSSAPRPFAVGPMLKDQGKGQNKRDGGTSAGVWPIKLSFTSHYSTSIPSLSIRSGHVLFHLKSQSNRCGSVYTLRKRRSR